MSVASRLSPLHTIIEHTRDASPLASKKVTLIGVSKAQSAALIEEAIAAGVKDFGENRVQEAEEKWPTIKAAHKEVCLHFIGALQTNKVKEAVALFDVIHSVDRESLADALMKEMQKQNRMLPCFIQVNTGEEEQKGGVAPKDADALIAYAKKIGLNIIGLMCVPPANVPAAPHFALLREIALRNNLKELSMGMSGDFETAIRMGATYIRVGTKLFGERVIPA